MINNRISPFRRCDNTLICYLNSPYTDSGYLCVRACTRRLPKPYAWYYMHKYRDRLSNKRAIGAAGVYHLSDLPCSFVSPFLLRLSSTLPVVSVSLCPAGVNDNKLTEWLIITNNGYTSSPCSAFLFLLQYMQESIKRIATDAISTRLRWQVAATA